MNRLRIAAIDFLNPAPLMYAFEHPPTQAELATRYSIERMTPARCAEQLASGDADLGLIPIAGYSEQPELAIVPGCTIASFGAIRSLLLIFPRYGHGATLPSTEPDALTSAALGALQQLRSVALDTSSRTTALYTRILFRKYWLREPAFLAAAPDLDAMLAQSDAALLIGDPALHALEDRAAREARTGQPLHYLDLGHAWHTLTGYPWISAFWAARPRALTPASTTQLIRDLTKSRDQGLAHLPELADEWSVQLHLPRATIHTYLSENIHYHLDPACLAGIHRFHSDAEECGLIERMPTLKFL